MRACRFVVCGSQGARSCSSWRSRFRVRAPEARRRFSASGSSRGTMPSDGARLIHRSSTTEESRAEKPGICGGQAGEPGWLLLTVSPGSTGRMADTSRSPAQSRCAPTGSANASRAARPLTHVFPSASRLGRADHLGTGMRGAAGIRPADSRPEVGLALGRPMRLGECGAERRSYPAGDSFRGTAGGIISTCLSGWQSLFRPVPWLHGDGVRGACSHYAFL